MVSNYPRHPTSQYCARPIVTWLRCLIPTMLLVVVTALAPAAFLSSQMASSYGLDLAGVLIADVVLSLPLIVVICRLFPITVSASGLKAFNGLGLYSHLPWDSIRQLSTINVFSLRYFRFKREGMLFAALVPYDLDHPQAFCAEVARYMGEESPIVASLRRSWHLDQVVSSQS